MKFKLLIASISACVFLISGCSSSSKMMSDDGMMNNDKMMDQ